MCPVWSSSALQFAPQDLKIALANTPSVHPLFVLYGMVYYKSVCALVPLWASQLLCRCSGWLRGSRYAVAYRQPIPE